MCSFVVVGMEDYRRLRSGWVIRREVTETEGLLMNSPVRRVKLGRTGIVNKSVILIRNYTSVITNQLLIYWFALLRECTNNLLYSHLHWRIREYTKFVFALQHIYSCIWLCVQNFLEKLEGCEADFWYIEP